MPQSIDSGSSSMNETSLTLLEQARTGAEPEAWRGLVQVYTPVLRGWIARYGLQASDVDDLVQDVLLAVSRDLPRFEHNGRPGAFRAWLRTILVHRLRHFWRSRDHRPLPGGGTSFAEQLDQLEDESSHASRLWNAEHDRLVISQLTERVRPRFQPATWEAFRRQMFDGTPPDRVAAELGIPVSTVYVARSRVLAALRREAAGLVDSL